MRRQLGLLVVVGLLLVSPVMAQWRASPFAGEGSRAAIGCSESGNDDTWLCLAVRCDAPGSIGLYLELTNLDVTDGFVIEIGDQRFAVTGSKDTEDAPYRNRLTGDVAQVVAALKSGSKALLDRPQYAFSPGFDTIPLGGSTRAISAVERHCGTGPTAQSDDAGPQLGNSLLPLKTGLYVRADATCATRDNVTTMSFWGTELNAQRVRGTIKSVAASDQTFELTISAYDIAEGASIGELNWTMIIPSRDSFSLGTPPRTYHWCEGLPG